MFTWGREITFRLCTTSMYFQTLRLVSFLSQRPSSKVLGAFWSSNADMLGAIPTLNGWCVALSEIPKPLKAAIWALFIFSHWTKRQRFPRLETSGAHETWIPWGEWRTCTLLLQIFYFLVWKAGSIIGPVPRSSFTEQLPQFADCWKIEYHSKCFVMTGKDTINVHLLLINRLSSAVVTSIKGTPARRWWKQLPSCG